MAVEAAATAAAAAAAEVEGEAALGLWEGMMGEEAAERMAANEVGADVGAGEEDDIVGFLETIVCCCCCCCSC